jgi:general secretion pathway protein D
MIKPPLTRSIASLLSFSIVAAQPFATGVAMAADSTEAAALREQARRHEYETRGQQAIDSADKAMKDKDYETAVSLYKAACDVIPNAPNSHGLYAEALHGFCKASCRFAEQRITEGRYLDAQNQLKLVLDDRYNPRCKEAVVILARLETPGYYNQTIGPKFRATVEEVKKLLLDAEGFYQSGRYDLAMKRTDQVLNFDPYNIAARKMQEKIHEEQDHAANVGYTEARSRMMWKVDKGWESPVRKFGLNPGTTIEQVDTDTAGTQRITAKLQSIVLPKLEFREATIREAVEFLKKKSVELDTKETDPARKGVNIVLKLEGGGGGGAAPAPVPAAPAIPGLEPLPGVAPAAAPVPEAAPSISPSDARITVSLANIPLVEALKYVTSLANLKFKIEPFAVAIVPQNVDITVLSTRQWKVKPGFIQRVSTGGGDAAGGLAPAPPADATKGGSALAGKVDAKEFLKSVGVSFPGDASATYLASGSRLVVRNTQENLDLVDTLVQNDVNTGASQVEIEAKFVEITQNNLKELSFDWLMGAANVPGTNKTFFSGGTSGTSPATSSSDFGFLSPDGTPVGNTPVTGGNRSGNLAISANAIDALLFGIPGASKLAPGVLSVAGVFTDPTFQVVVRALNQKKGVDLLSAPKVTTKSGQRAVIEIIREFRYPTEFDPPQIPQNFGNTGIGGGVTTINPLTGLLSSSGSQGSFPVTPTTPTAFETRNTGVTLEVEPTVGPDGYTVDLNLVPQDVELEGLINYGTVSLTHLRAH